MKHVRVAHVSILGTCLLYCLAASLAHGQSARPSGRSVVIIDGPPPPVPPAVAARDSDGRLTMRAVSLEDPLNVDGRLDERIYSLTPAVSGFFQQEPLEGEPATERTEAWIFFDANNVYVAVRCWYSEPDRILANEMRRDSINIYYNDSLTVVFDTHYDRRTGYFFQTNALGAVRDALATEGQIPNNDWNAVWDVASRRFEQGWTTELAIPFKSLRYQEGREQIWGVNLRRIAWFKNETTHLVPIPASSAAQGVMKFSSAATLVGIEPPSSSRNLEFKPYAITSLATDRDARPPITNDPDGDIGFDGKYGLTRSLTLDVTYNTDFAQVEADNEEVNLSRFSLFFPEKREFFLEGRGAFEFGGGGDAPILFFSRRIGLSGGRRVPIRVGGRISGRAGKFTVGVLNIQTGDAPDVGAASTNFSVVRVKRDILRRSTIGAIATGRSRSSSGAGSNEAVGIDAALRFFQDVEIDTYYARTRTSALSGDADSYQGAFRYEGDRYGLAVDRLKVGDAFNPEVGFVRRRDFARDYVQARFSPRPRALAGVRKLSWSASFERFVSGDQVLESRAVDGSFNVDVETGDSASLSYTNTYELLRQPFPIAPAVVVPIGGYTFQNVRATYRLGPQRRFNGSMSVTRGSFFSGERTTLSGNSRMELTPQLSLEPRLSVNWVDLPEGRFTTRLVSSRASYTLTPRMFVSGLVQYNSSNDYLSTNLRLRWGYSPGSELFVVYDENRDTDPFTPNRFSEIRNRAFVVKVNRLFRF